jgi:branched-chain amino acid transport system permease protein
MLVNKEDLYAAAIAAALVIALSLFFQYTSTGRALRAVADDHQAAQSIGIPLNAHLGHRLVGGRLRRAGGRHHLGQQAGRAVLALAGGAEGAAGGHPRRPHLVPGAIIGGLIIGVGEKLSEVFIGPMLGGGIEIWFGYVLVLLVLLVRPQGLFGEKIIDRV